MSCRSPKCPCLPAPQLRSNLGQPCLLPILPHRSSRRLRKRRRTAGTTARPARKSGTAIPAYASAPRDLHLASPPVSGCAYPSLLLAWSRRSMAADRSNAWGSTSRETYASIPAQAIRARPARNLKARFTLRNLLWISPALPFRFLKTRSVSQNLLPIPLKNKEKLTLMSYIRPCCDASKALYNISTLLASVSVAAHATLSSQTRFISRKLTWPSIKTTSRQLPV